MRISKTGAETLKLEYKLEVFMSGEEDDQEIKAILTLLDCKCALIAEQLMTQNSVLKVIVSMGCEDEDPRKFCETHTWAADEKPSGWVPRGR